MARPKIPPKGVGFIAWKKVVPTRYNEDFGWSDCVAMLWIPPYAERVLPIGCNKGRASEVYVLDIISYKNKSVLDSKLKFKGPVYPTRKGLYHIGAVVTASSRNGKLKFDNNRHIPCAAGIHFCFTKASAWRFS